MDHRDAGSRVVLITGAAGFLGRAVVDHARAIGLRVRATDRRRGDLPADLDFRPADVVAPETLRGLFDGVDCVVHAAGLAHVFDKSQAVVAPFHEINAIGAAHVARAAAKAGVGAMALVSSVSVYGRHTGGMVDETFPCRPESPYAKSKYQAEQLAAEISRAADMRLTTLRLATLYGEGDPGNVAKLFRAIDRRRFLWIGNGSNRKSLVYRDDAARACIAAAIHQGPIAGTYNVASQPCTMRQIVDAIAGALSRRLPAWRIPAKTATTVSRVAGALTLGRTRIAGLPDAIQKWLADDAYNADRFARDFGFNTEVTLAEGIRREAAWLRAASRIAA